MGLANLFKKNEALLALDIGSHALKLVEIDTSGATPRLVNAVTQPLKHDVYSNNIITKGEEASDEIHSLLESHDIEPKRVVTAMPGPSVFTKKIKLQKMPLADLKTNIQFEAGNFIPHNIDAVKLDFHILGETGKNQLDVLVVAVKNEIINSFTDAIALAGLDTAIVDVDYFALQNVFEFNYPEVAEETVALINMGSRYSSINICKGGVTLFTGDMSIGGKQVSETLEGELGMSEKDADEAKEKAYAGDADARVDDVLSQSAQQIAEEFNRQLSFFWSASGSEEGIDKIFLTGGGSLIKGLTEQLAEKTGLDTEQLRSLKEIDYTEVFDDQEAKSYEPLLSVALGLGIRESGDKIIPNYL